MALQQIRLTFSKNIHATWVREHPKLRTKLVPQFHPAVQLIHFPSRIRPRKLHFKHANSFFTSTVVAILNLKIFSSRSPSAPTCTLTQPCAMASSCERVVVLVVVVVAAKVVQQVRTFPSRIGLRTEIGVVQYSRVIHLVVGSSPPLLCCWLKVVAENWRRFENSLEKRFWDWGRFVLRGEGWGQIVMK